MASGGGGTNPGPAASDQPVPGQVNGGDEASKAAAAASSDGPASSKAPAAGSSGAAKGTPKKDGMLDSLKFLADLPEDAAGKFDQLMRSKMKEVTGLELPEGVSLTTVVKKASQEAEETKKKSAEADLEKLWSDLDEIKVTMMHDMVGMVSATIAEQQVKSRFMYLTNKQAQLVDVAKMPEVREQLGIFEPKMVIRLMPSRYGTEYWKAFKNWSIKKNGVWGGRFPMKQVPELHDSDIEETEHRLILLVKEVLLPLAQDSHALVIGNETCSLVTAFVKVSAPLIRQYQDKCPFRLLIFARAQYFTLQAEKPGSVAHAFFDQSRRWKREHKKIASALKERWGDDQGFWPQSDLQPGEYSLILFECLSDDKLAEETSRNFQNDFIQSLSTYLPVIAVQTYGTEKMSLLPAMADHAKRNLPLFLLDSRKRMVKTQVAGDDFFEPEPDIIDDPDLKALAQRGWPGKTAEKYYQEFAKKLSGRLEAQRRALHEKMGGGCVDFYTTSLIANVKDQVNKAIKFKKETEQPGEKPSADRHDGNEKQKKQWLWQAIADGRKEKKKSQGNDHRDSEDQDQARSKTDPDELLHVFAADEILTYFGSDVQWESDGLRQRCEDAITELEQANTWDELRTRLKENWGKLRGFTLHKYGSADKVVSANGAWLRWDAEDVNCPDPCMRKRLAIVDMDPDEGALPEARDKITKLFRDEQSTSESFARRNSLKAIKGNEELWMSIYDLMKSDNVYAGNLHNISNIRNALFRHAQIDRLPSKNSQEALLLLRRAWVLVDLYHHNARFYKYVSKFAYLLTLMFGVTIVVISVLQPFYKEVLDADTSQKLLLALALCLSGITGATTMVDPTTKWLMLKGTALAVESEVWKFRTRVGEYQGETRNGSNIGQSEAERFAERAFHEKINALQDKVHQSSGLKDTSFYANTTATGDDEDDDIPGRQDGGGIPEEKGCCARYCPRRCRCCPQRSDQVEPWSPADVMREAEDSPPADEHPLSPLMKSHKDAGDGLLPIEPADPVGCCSRICSGCTGIFACCRSPRRCCSRQRGERNAQMSNKKKARKYKHGQYGYGPRVPEKDDEWDNFHSPANMREYIKFRLVPQMQFYQKRIPRYAILRRIFQTLLLGASIINALLAALNEPTWTAIVASVSGAFAAWQEFSSTAKKLERYSTAANTLSNTLLWWQALQEVDQSNFRKIEFLVEQTEGLLGGERAAWLSDAQQAAKLAKEKAKSGQDDAGDANKPARA